jgi:DNA topoisomerase-1
VQAALARPGNLDANLVDAEQACRILDRLVGYQVSPVLWKAVKTRKGLSAGRVQTVVLRLVVGRDLQIEGFEAGEYWLLEIELSKVPDQSQCFRARLVQVEGERADLETEREVQPIVDRIGRADRRVLSKSSTRRRRRPFRLYTTSTLQRDAAWKPHWGASKTMRVAQQLYEGMSLPEEGTIGLIAYVRTDSTHVAEKAQGEARELIGRYWGANYAPEEPPQYKTRSKVAQEAQEAIRPTPGQRAPKVMRAHLTRDQAKLYQWVWRGFVGS